MKDEPFITLPTTRLIAVTIACCAAIAGAWAGVTLAMGYDGQTQLGGAVGAGLTGLCIILMLLLTVPWIAKPASTAMLLWIGSDLVAVALSLGAAYLLYSATFLGLQPLFLGVAATFLLVLLGKAILVASHVRKHYP